MEEFDYSLDFEKIDFRLRPDLYRIGRGEQGVLLVEPYKSELLPHWRFRTPELAQQSADKIYALYLDYRDKNDFVGMDMARKFLQMGFSRARRYAKSRSGRKAPRENREGTPALQDPDKARSAELFWEKWHLVLDDPVYQKQREEHLHRYERPKTSPGE